MKTVLMNSAMMPDRHDVSLSEGKSCVPNQHQTSPDCSQIASMGEYGRHVYGAGSSNDNGYRPVYAAASTSTAASYGNVYSSLDYTFASVCSSLMLGGAVVFAMILMRLGARRGRW